MEPDSKSYILSDSIYATFWKKQNYMTRNQICDCWELEVGGERGKW